MLLKSGPAHIDRLAEEAWGINRKDPHRAIELGNELLSLSENENYVPGKAQACKVLGIAHVWISNNEEAFSWSLKALHLFRELNDMINEATVCYNLGTNFYYLSDYDNALKYYSECYHLNEKADNQAGVAEGLNGLGTVYYTIEQNEKAFDALSRALAVCEAAGEMNLITRILDGMGETCFNLKKYDEALAFYFRCIDVLDKTNGPLQVKAFALDGIGRSHAANGDFENATQAYAESLRIRREIGFRVGETTSLVNIGRMYHTMHNPQEALTHLLLAMDIAREINSKEGIYKAGEALALVYETTGDAANALKYFKLFHEAKEIVRDESSARRSKSLEMQFRVERAEADRKLLEQKNNELQNYFDHVVLLSEIGKKITGSLSVDEIVETVYENVNALMDASGFGIGLAEPGEKIIIYPLYIEEGERMEMIRYDLADKNRLTVYSYDNNAEVVINDFRTEVTKYITVVQSPLAGRNIESLIYLPLVVKDKKLGVITVQSFNKNAYTDYHLNILRSIAMYAGIALENARLYSNVEETVAERTKELTAQKEEVERSHRNTRLLSDIGQQITSTLDFESIFTKLHESVSKLMAADCFGIRVYHPEKNEVEYKFEIERGEKQDTMSVSMDDRDNYSVWCILNRKEIFINDNLTEYKKYTSAIRVVSGDMPHSLIFFPLMLGEKVLGVITVQSFSRDAYKPYHLDILRTLASYTAIAFENANLYEGLEEKVKERTVEIIRQKEIIETKNKDITDSIRYAKKIQQAILPTESEMTNEFPQSFVFYKPKDIVSGDFYWYAALGETIVFAVADCTGHGVPGAFMSAICNDLMNQVIRDGRVTTPGMALQLLDIKLRQLLNKSAETGANDGMDIALCALNTTTNFLQYAGAHRPMIIVRNESLIEFKPDKLSIGGYNTEKKQFTDHGISLQKDDLIYLFTDGYTDQFGGAKGKKFKYRQLKSLLESMKNLSAAEQKKLLGETISKWRASHEQVDDILLLGVRI